MGRAAGTENAEATISRRLRGYVEVQVAPPSDHEGHPSCGEWGGDGHGCGTPWLDTLHTVTLWDETGGETVAETLCRGCAYSLADDLSARHGGLPVRVKRFEACR